MTNRITVEGETFEVDDHQISIEDGNLYCGNQIIAPRPLSGDIRIIWEGDLANVYSDCTVICKSVHGDVRASGSVRCGNVEGDVVAGGSVDARSCGSRIIARGSVRVVQAVGVHIGHGKIDARSVDAGVHVGHHLWQR